MAPWMDEWYQRKKNNLEYERDDFGNYLTWLPLIQASFLQNPHQRLSQLERLQEEVSTFSVNVVYFGIAFLFIRFCLFVLFTCNILPYNFHLS